MTTSQQKESPTLQTKTKKTSAPVKITPSEFKPGNYHYVMWFLTLLFRLGGPRELRILFKPRDGRAGAHAAVFDVDHVDKMARHVMSDDLKEYVGGVYITLNPAQLDHIPNGFQKENGTCTDRDVLRRTLLLIDIDPIRIDSKTGETITGTKVCSTAEELEAAKRVGAQVRELLCGKYGWPEPVVAMSGNGIYLLFRVDLPVDDGGIVQQVLNAVAFLTDSDDVDIDTSVYNAGRLMRVLGTKNKKGSNSKERPHRYSAILETPEMWKVVPTPALKSVASLLPEERREELKSTGKRQAQSPSVSESDLAASDEWLGAWMRFNIYALQSLGLGMPRDGSDWWRRKWALQQCPLQDDHDNAATYLMLHSSGAYSAGCLHNSCQGWGWSEFREEVERRNLQIIAERVEQLVSEFEEAWAQTADVLSRSELYQQFAETKGFVELIARMDVDARQRVRKRLEDLVGDLGQMEEGGTQ